MFGCLLWRPCYIDRFFITNKEKKNRDVQMEMFAKSMKRFNLHTYPCNKCTSANMTEKKRKIGTALSWRKTQSSFIVDCCEPSCLPKTKPLNRLFKAKFWNNYLSNDYFSVLVFAYCNRLYGDLQIFFLSSINESHLYLLPPTMINIK